MASCAGVRPCGGAAGLSEGQLRRAAHRHTGQLDRLSRSWGTPGSPGLSQPCGGLWCKCRVGHAGTDTACPVQGFTVPRKPWGPSVPHAQAVFNTEPFQVVSLSPGHSLTAARHGVRDPLSLLVTYGSPSLFSQGGPRTRSGFWTLDFAKRSAAAVWGHGGLRVLLGDGHAVPPDVLLHTDAPQRAGPACGYVAAGHAPRWSHASHWTQGTPAR